MFRVDCLAVDALKSPHIRCLHKISKSGYQTPHVCLCMHGTTWLPTRWIFM